jgi:hypothetical protein
MWSGTANQELPAMDNLGWIEIVMFYGIAIGFGVWQFWKTDRLLKRTRAENAAKKANEGEGKPPSS